MLLHFAVENLLRPVSGSARNMVIEAGKIVICHEHGRY